jgi:hypothetical protein
MHSKTFMFRGDAEEFALNEGERLDAHAIVGQNRLNGLWSVSLFLA